MSEHPGRDGAGRVRPRRLRGRRRRPRPTCCRSDVRAGDRIVGIASPGLRCNGYSLAACRAARPRRARPRRARRGPARTTSLAEELLRPSVIYAPAMLRARARGRRARVRARHRRRHPRQPRAGAARPTATRVVARGTWDEPRIFAEIQRAGDVADDEMEHVFNLGLGMLAVVAARRRVARGRRGPRAGHDAWLVGEIVDGHGRVRMTRRRTVSAARAASGARVVALGLPRCRCS